MNRLTSQQRKLVYLAGIVLLVPLVIWLGMPATGEATPGERATGGKLAELRQEYDLGETTLGDVDPASATMNLVLLGFRGPASTLLRMELEEQQKTKDWAGMRATTESIILLQPNYLQVWRFQGWNLAYNVSAEWDAVSDRYYWVKEGGKFMMKGSERNARHPELYWETGNILGKKIGRSDEWQFFRRYFVEDPDQEIFDGGPDPEFNPGATDNYLAAKEWFHVANDVELDQRQHIMERMLFRQYPARSQLDYADALQREGFFDETTQYAWDEAFQDWTRRYRNGKEGFGRELFETPGGSIRLESTEEDFRELAERDGVDVQEKRDWTDRYQKMSNYRYWRTRALAEAEPETVAAHRELYQGQQYFKEGRLREAREILESGMEKYADMFRRHPSLMEETVAQEEGLMAILYWQYTLRLLGESPPQNFALRGLWESQQALVPQLDERFRRENALQALE